LESQLLAMLVGVRSRIHGEHGRDMRDLDGSSWKYRTLRTAFRPLVSRYIPLSQELHQYLLQDVGIPANKIRLICNGVDIDRFRPSENGRSILPVPDFAPPGCTVIGNVGRMEPVKDPITLARAFIELVTKCPEKAVGLRLAMIGDGSLRQPVKDILKEANLSHMAWLPGNRDDVPDLLRAMDIFVLPSLAEGISNTILEAMASGLPVVATDVGGNAELVVEGETGFLVPQENPQAMANAIARYQDNFALIRTHGAMARARAQSRFSLDRMVGQYLDVYDDVLRERA